MVDCRFWQLLVYIAIVSRGRRHVRGVHACVRPNQASADVRSDLQPQKRREVFVLIFRDCLLAFQALHLARIFEGGDSLVGILGMVTSIIDIARVWPVQRCPKQEQAATAVKQDESQQCAESEFGEAGSTFSGQTSTTRESFESEVSESTNVQIAGLQL